MDSTKKRRLQAIYASLPTIECKRLCADSCGPMGMGGIEERRIVAARGGRAIGKVAPPSIMCPMLRDNTCTVYKVRPLLCRLWGVMESLPCTYGCRPDPRYLTDAEGYGLLEEVIEVLSGGVIYATASDEIVHLMARAHRREVTLDERDEAGIVG